MTEGTLAKWLKTEGENITAGDALAEIETDKATMEVEAADEGVLGRILVAAGTENVAINTPIAMLLQEGEDTAALSSAPVAAPLAEAPAAPPAETAPPAPVSPASAEADTPGPTVTQTVREALRDAMTEEMRRDERVFLIGEEVAQYQGAYKVSQGLLEEFGDKRVIDTPITELGFTGLGVGASFAGLRPDRRVHDLQLRHAGDRPDRQLGGQDPVHVGRPDGGAGGLPRAQRPRLAGRRPAFPVLRLVVRPLSRAEGGGALFRRRRQGPLEIGDPRPEPDHLPGERIPLRPQLRGAERPGFPGAHRPSQDRAAGHGRHHCHILAHGGVGTGGGEALAGEGIEAEIIDLRSLRPLDTVTVAASVKRTNRLVTVEEGWPYAGIGAELTAAMMDAAFDWLDAPVKRVTGADVPMPYAANLERLALPQAEDIAAAAKAVCYRS